MILGSLDGGLKTTMTSPEIADPAEVSWFTSGNCRLMYVDLYWDSNALKPRSEPQMLKCTQIPCSSWHKLNPKCPGDPVLPFYDVSLCGFLPIHALLLCTKHPTILSCTRLSNTVYATNDNIYLTVCHVPLILPHCCIHVFFWGWFFAKSCRKDSPSPQCQPTQANNVLDSTQYQRSYIHGSIL